MATLLDELSERIIVGDGAMGTLLQSRGIPVTACLEELNLSQPDLIRKVHEDYLNAGARVIETNSFAANRPRLEKFALSEKLSEINWQAARIAKEAAKSFQAYVAGSVGPLALRPSEKEAWTPSDIVRFYMEQIGALLDGGVDAIFLETFADIDELKAALYAFRSLDNCPVLCSLACTEDGHLAGGQTVLEAFKILKEEGATLLGFNATLGPRAMINLFHELPIDADVPYAAFPNAGKPQFLEGHYFFYATTDYFAKAALELVTEGVRLIGGCVGTEPEHIHAVAQAVKQLQPVKQKAIHVTKREVIHEKAPTFRPQSLPEESLLEICKRKRTIIVELDTPKILSLDKFMKGSRILHEAGADAITLADNSLAILRVGNFAAGTLLQQEGIRTVLHLACRDRNLLGLQSELMGLHTLGINHILVITGDPAKVGDHPGATSVYDVNSVGLIRILAEMNQGRSAAGKDLKKCTRFIIGCSFNPNAKNFDSQVKKLESKLATGAHFVMTQPIFDATLAKRTAEATRSFGVPIFVGVMPLIGSRNTEFLHNEVPGISIPESIRERMQNKEGEEGAKEGLKIAQEIQSEVLEYFNGVYLITPLLRYEMSLELIQASKTI